MRGAVMLDLTNERLRMVNDQIAKRGVRDPAVLAAMRRVPRELFLPDELGKVCTGRCYGAIGRSGHDKRVQRTEIE